MKIFLNERSIPEKSLDSQEIYEALSRLICIAGMAKKLSNNQQIQRHRDLKYKEVLVGKSLLEYIIELGNDADPKKRQVKALFLELFAKAPFLVGFHNGEETVTNLENECLKNSCFDDAIACKTGAAAISAANPKEIQSLDFLVRSSVFGQRKILNITTVEQLISMLWVYESNEKHDIPKDVIVEGEIHSAMPLSKEDAQRLLSNGVMIGKCVYNKVGEQWYKFHCHEKNIYHGFPINVRTPYKDFSTARIIFNEIGNNVDGQILADLIETRS
jgi:hypothetical protein